MRKKILLGLLISITLFSCTSNDDDFQNEKVEVSNNDLIPEKLLKSIVGLDGDEINQSDYYQLFSYNNQGQLLKVKKDYGSFIYPVYLNLEYNGNTVTVKDKIDDNSVVTSKKSLIYTLDNNGKIIEKYIPAIYSIYDYTAKKYYYEYNPDGKLFRVTLRYPNLTPGMANYDELDIFERIDTFIYDGNNLKKIISQSVKEYNSNSSARTETVFLDYDNARNPFKRLGLLESYFYRSLSQNNYREMKIDAYDENNVSIGQSSSKWVFSYDNNNDMILRFD